MRGDLRVKPKRARRAAARTGAAASLLLAATALLSGCSKRGAAQGGAGGFKMPPMPVEVASVVQAPVVDRFDAIGTLEAGEAITVVSEIDGTVVELPFREGGAVSKGDVLARLDDVQLRAEVARAEALRDQSQLKHDRVKTIVEQQAGAPQDLDNAAAELKVAEAALAVAQARLDKTKIIAPWDGIVGARTVSPGAFVRAGQAITNLTQVREMKVRFSAPERYLGTLLRGAVVRITTPAFPGEEVEGRIDVVEPVLDAELRSAKIQARLANPGGKLRPGMSADVSAVLYQRDAAITIPSEAVFVEGTQALVFVVKPDSSVARLSITLGTRLPDRVEVTSGLEPGQKVVRAGHQKLYEGAKVLPVMTDGGGGGPSAPAADPR